MSTAAWMSKPTLPPLVRLDDWEGRPLIINMEAVSYIAPMQSNTTAYGRSRVFFKEGGNVEVRGGVEDIWKGLGHAQG